MMDSSSDIDLSLTNIWRAWWAFRAGKKLSQAIVLFESGLEFNLLQLCVELNKGGYSHGNYNHRIINENKRRDIVVATVRDRVVHRLLYDYLVLIWDKTFIYDVWSCRKGKGLHAAIERAQQLMWRHQNCWVWRTDITKLFDSIDQPKMKQLLRRRIDDPLATKILDEVIDSYNALASKQAHWFANWQSHQPNTSQHLSE